LKRIKCHYTDKEINRNMVIN